ncbi:MAG: hypothetical protein QOF72_2173 [Blastocatellia bacterium]|jgi:hypothetical protein|nr:hypothetical protein [Blastocatellia bacterium]
MNKLSLTANIISIVSGFITILGIGGIVSWSIFGKDRGAFQRKVALIFAFSLKTAFCLIVLSLVGFFALLIHVIIIGFSRGLTSSTFYWDAQNPTFYLISYGFQILFLLPLYLILCSCIYEWSFEPLKRLTSAFNKNRS